jgi:hypothetical protein
MPTSSDGFRRVLRNGRWSTAGLTALVSLLLFALAWLVPLETRNGRGEAREMSAFDVWRDMLDNIHPDVPFFLSGPVLAVLSILALIASAYVLVAIARLPQ